MEPCGLRTGERNGENDSISPQIWRQTLKLIRILRFEAGPMPWFRHHYYCEACDGTWLGEMEIVIESDCPFCGVREVSPYKSDDRTRIVEQRGDKFVVLECRKSAVSGPDYLVRGRFPSRATAEAFVASHGKAA